MQPMQGCPLRGQTSQGQQDRHSLAVLGVKNMTGTWIKVQSGLGSETVAWLIYDT